MLTKRLWIHIAIWGVIYIGWVALFQHRTLTLSRTATVQFCYLIFIAGNFYLHLYYAIPRLLYRNKYLNYAFVLILGILGGALLRTLLALYITKTFFHDIPNSPGFDNLFGDSLLNISFWIILILAVYLLVEKIRFRKYLFAIEQQKTRHELDFLKAQFNPHFLFNSINSIYGHIDKSNPIARKMLLTFSDMLRYQLYECSSDMIAIDREISYIRNYVWIQQARKDDNLAVTMLVRDNVKGFKIAPMLFIGFIENAFKYVSNHESGENKVSICFEMEKDALLFTALNTKETRNGKMMKDSGIGISNTRRRLELLYPDKYKLDICDCEEKYQVALKINLS